MRNGYAFVGSALAVLAAAACGGSGGHPGGGGTGGTGNGTLSSVIDLRADVNRNGIIDMSDPSEDEDEDTFDAAHGAIFLPNIDDDTLRCPKGSDIEQLSDQDLAGCFDAADDVVNGDEDLKDMARLRTAAWADAPDDAKGTIQIGLGAEYVRVFKNNGGKFELLPPDGVLTAAELRAGVELALEGKDFVRDADVWDGNVDVTLHVDGGTVPPNHPRAGEAYPSGDDKVRLHVAPLLLSHHLQPAEQIYATKVPMSAASAEFRADLGDAAGNAQISGGLVECEPHDVDQWTQDWMEIGWTSMPAAGGEQHSITVYIRSVNVEKPGDPASPLRPAGRWVYQTELTHGVDVAGYTPPYDLKAGHGEMDSLNSYGNTETLPPFEHNGKKWPMGRIYRGSVSSFHPDPVYQKMLDSQGRISATSPGIQETVTVDTSWLLVGHVDETITFLRMKNALGWGIGANDVALAKKMLEDIVAAGYGDVPIFEGLQAYTDQGTFVDAQTTAAGILANTEVMGESAAAAVEVDAQIDILKKEVGITDADIVPFPFLHEKSFGYSLAYQPGTVNGIHLSDTHYGAP
jgi:protein-arginine deiminase